MNTATLVVEGTIVTHNISGVAYRVQHVPLTTGKTMIRLARVDSGVTGSGLTPESLAARYTVAERDDDPHVDPDYGDWRAL